jgi:hypothetical protein
VVMGMLVVDEVCVLSGFIGSAAKWQGYHSPDSSERQSSTHGPAELGGSDMPALDSLRAASLFYAPPREGRSQSPRFSLSPPSHPRRAALQRCQNGTASSD